jgi:hypothetical protein
MMNTLTTFETWYGRDEPPPETVKLRAGDLELEFEAGDLRYIGGGSREFIRRIYVAIRDVNWNTIPFTMSDLVIDAADDHFHIGFKAVNVAGDLRYRWRASIIGQPDGTIEYTMDGAAESDFRYCRIGFCVLHPVAGIAGSPYRATTPNGVVSGVLPELVEPQTMIDGFEVPIFDACSSLTIEMPDGTQVLTDFEGDLFEMEDQRNWTDGSFKTYCTPLALGYPHTASAGQHFRQKVIVKVDMPNDSSALSGDESTISLKVGDMTDSRLPRIGFGMSENETEVQAGAIERLRPDHLKIELHFRDSSWPADLDRAINLTRQIGSSLEVAIFLEDDSAEPLATLKSQLQDVSVARVIVFHEAEAPVGTTSAQWMTLVRQHLPDVPLFGGTNGNFAELNRQRPDISIMDGVTYTINPQVHASDERSLIEALEAQRDTVVTARSYCGTLPICISSVTLKPPFNQAATEDEAPENPNELPAAVDQRQMSLFAAAWTVGSLRSLALGGADSITYYETAGWRGLIETAAGSRLPEQFRSLPGMNFPVYWIFAFLADAPQATLFETRLDKPLLIDGLAFQSGKRFGLLIVNLQPRDQTVHLSGLPVGAATVRRLNTESVSTANPDNFLQMSQLFAVQDGTAVHQLDSYETAFIEIEIGG